MGRPRKWKSDAERKRAERAAKQNETAPAPEPEEPPEGEVVQTEALESMLQQTEADAGQPWEGLQGEEREQAIRNYWGYSASEKRTQAERQAVAERIVNG